MTKKEIDSLLGNIQTILCNVPHQDFKAGSAVREMRRAFTSKGSKRINAAQKKTLFAVLKITEKSLTEKRKKVLPLE